MRIISRGSSIPNRTISTWSSSTVGGTSRYRTSLASMPRPSNKRLRRTGTSNTRD